jgi:hypothetical protein
MRSGRLAVIVSVAVAAAACSSSQGSGGALRIDVAGLPSGVAANIAIDGPAGFHTTLNSGTTLNGLAAGAYTATAAAIVVGPDAYQAAQATQQVSVSSGNTASIKEQFAVVPATLQVNIDGLPAGSSAAVTITGPNGYTEAATTSTTLSGLAPGDYTVTAAAVSPGGVLYTPVPATQSARVSPGAQLVAGIEYSHPESSLAITIGAVYIDQAVQSTDGSVPLIPDRPGMLRVFLVGSEANSATPDVRVRLYYSGTLSSTYIIRAPGGGVPLAIDASDSAGSWNLLLAERQIEPGLQILVDVDPNGVVPLATRANLVYPANGVPVTMTLRSGPVYQLEFVPIVNSSDGIAGTIGDTAALTEGLRLLHPMWHYTAGIHAPFAYSGGPFEPSDANDAWQLTLQQVEMLRQTEGSSSYYYGVVHLNYSSGTVGLGYIGQPAVANYRAAIGWDESGSYPPFAEVAAETYAHELGHNLGLLHAPCGGASNPDPAFPYPNGKAGGSGFNVLTGQIVTAPSYDLMSYCSPIWISDYSYRKLLTYAQASLAAPPVATRSVLVSGVIRQSGSFLNPALVVTAPPVTPTAPGRYRLVGTGTDGSQLFDFTFDPPQVGDAGTTAIHPFVFTVPLAGSLSLGSLRLTGPGVDTTLAGATHGSLVGDTTSVTATRITASEVRFVWSPVRYPMVMIRDAATGSVLAIARGGSSTLRGKTSTFLVSASDGVASTDLRLTP